MPVQNRSDRAQLEVLSDDCATMDAMLIGHQELIGKRIGFYAADRHPKERVISSIESQRDRDVLIVLMGRMEAVREQIQTIKLIAEQEMK